MQVIRILWGSGRGPTSTAAYDAALAAANVHNYNLVSVSSVIPPGTPIDVVGEAPDLGPPGNRLTVVEARSTVGPSEADRVAAGLGWAREPQGPGIFYEAGGTEPDAVRGRIHDGLEAGKGLRGWAFDIQADRVVDTEATTDAFTAVVVLAVYGRGTPIL